ncbi:PAS domain S-box protein [bacterium]|nr:PAS domain S-box protein [bacterium]
MDANHINILIFMHFFFIAITLLVVFYYTYRLRLELKYSIQLKAESDRYKDLFNLTSEGVVELDLEGHFIIINRGGAQILGYDFPHQLLSNGKRFQDFYLKTTLWEQLLNDVVESAQTVRQVAQFKNSHKGQIWIGLTFHAQRNNQNEITGVEGIFRDITERLVIQKELENYSENLERNIEEKTTELLQLERHKFNLEKLAATGQLVAQLVHELRNPLSSIKMGLTTLYSRSSIIEKDRRIIEVTLREVTHLERMMKDLLAYAKPETLKFVPHQINTILEQTLEKMQAQLEAVRCEVISEYGENLPCVPVDMERMIQVLANVILNAQQASTEGGHLLVQSSFCQQKNCVSVTIRDFGEGIAPDQIEHIFKPFFSRREGGTGLGLSVVKAIVEAHGGEVSVQSDAGKGTTVKIDLPENQDQKTKKRNRIIGKKKEIKSKKE